MKYSALEGKTGLAHSVTIYVPTTQGTSEPAHESVISANVDFVSKELAKLFGGFTMTQGTGGYVAENGELVTEGVYMIRANAAELSHTTVRACVSIAELVRDFMEQECVSLEVDGVLYFV